MAKTETKIERAKRLDAAKTEKINLLLSGACYGKIDYNSQTCGTCLIAMKCASKSNEVAIENAVTAEKSKSKGKGKKTSVKNSRKVGII